VETDTATIGIKNWIGQQMVQIYKHCCNHNQTCLPPILLPEKLCEYKWYQQVKRVMDEVPEYVGANFHQVFDSFSSL